VKKRKVLFLTQVLPYPLVGGAKIRAYYALRYLSNNYRITLVSFTRSDDVRDYTEHLECFCERVVTVPISRSRWTDAISAAKSFITGHPAVIYRDNMAEMEQALKDLVLQEQYEIVHCDQTAMAQYGLYVRQLKNGRKTRLVLDQHNALYKAVDRQADQMTGWRQTLWKSESTRLALYEAKLIREFDSVLTVSEVDSEALLSLLEDSEKALLAPKFSAVPICIDPAERNYLEREPSSTNIVFLGTMYWPPNAEAVLWFARKIMPKVLAKVPSANLIVIGKNPPDEVKALEPGEGLISGHVQITGFVSDPEPILQKCAVFIVPVLAAGGMRVKILDAWLWGLPIVSTTIGAEGVEVRPGKNILIADDPDDFSEAVVNVLKNRKLANALSISGRKWVEEKYSWQEVYHEIGNVYRNLIQENEARESLHHISSD
jgi:glycosyltransferase involved in cell wall biosynthesis